MRLTRSIAAGLLAAAMAMSATAQPPRETGVLLRVSNATGRMMEHVQFGSPVNLRLERMAPGEATAYQPGPRMIGAIYVEATIDGEHHVLQPVDLLGPRYRPGRYTYLLTLSPSTVPGRPPRLNARMVADR